MTSWLLTSGSRFTVAACSKDYAHVASCSAHDDALLSRAATCYQLFACVAMNSPSSCSCSCLTVVSHIEHATRRTLLLTRENVVNDIFRYRVPPELFLLAASLVVGCPLSATAIRRFSGTDSSDGIARRGLGHLAKACARVHGTHLIEKRPPSIRKVCSAPIL